MQKILFWFIALIFAVQAVSSWYRWDITHPWIDIPLHIAGGAWIALLFFYLFGERIPVIASSAPQWARIFLAVGFAVFIASGWEVFEYIVGALGRQFPWGGGGGGQYFDSLKDIVDGFIGGSIAASWYTIRHHGDTPRNSP